VSKVSVLCSFACRDGSAPEMEALLADMVEAAVDEPGVEIYSFHRGHGNTFWFFALVRDRDVLSHLNHNAAVNAFRAEFEKLVESPPQISVTIPVAAIGLDLDLDEETPSPASSPRTRDATGIDLTRGST
jgi:quinol monooxygenase YgiN